MPNNKNMIRLKRGELRVISPDKAKHTDVYQPRPKNAVPPPKTVDEQVAAAKANEEAAKKEMNRVLKEHDEVAKQLLEAEALIKELKKLAEETPSVPESTDPDEITVLKNELEIANRSAKQWEAEAKLNLQNAEDAKAEAARVRKEAKEEDEAVRKAAKEKSDALVAEVRADAEKKIKGLEEKLALTSPEVDQTEIDSIPVAKVKKLKKSKDGSKACVVCEVDYDAAMVAEGVFAKELSIIIPMEEGRKLRRIGGPKNDEPEQDE